MAVMPWPAWDPSTGDSKSFVASPSACAICTACLKLPHRVVPCPSYRKGEKQAPVPITMTNWGVSGYAPAEWHEFFVAAVGASAALLGLLFVTISINLEHILKYRHLPGKAAGTLGTLLSVLLVCSFGLAPGQSNRTLGVEILATAAVVATQAIWVSVGKRSEGDPLSWTLGNLPLLLLPALAFVGGGCSLLAGSGGGLYWILAGTVLGFVAASLNAWVLLVEIVR
jgi:hypothetical protein